MLKIKENDCNCNDSSKEIDSNKVIETEEFKIVQMLFKPVNCLFRYRIYDKTISEDCNARIDVEIWPDSIVILNTKKRYYSDETGLSIWQFEALKLLPINIVK